MAKLERKLIVGAYSRFIEDLDTKLHAAIGIMQRLEQLQSQSVYKRVQEAVSHLMRALKECSEVRVFSELMRAGLPRVDG